MSIANDTIYDVASDSNEGGCIGQVPMDDIREAHE